MLTRKSGMLALVLGVAMLGAACESKDGDVIVTPPPTVVTLRIAPNPVPTLNVTTPASTFQLVAVISGTTTQTATWSSSNTAVADVDNTGKVTAKAAGTTVITAVSTVDATARDAVTVTVGSGGGGPIGTTTISINSVTVGATIVPVNPGAVAGRIVATLNVDIPAGSPASAVRVLMNGIQICRQDFNLPTSVVSEEISASAVPVEIQCPINTAAVNPDGTPVFVNGLLQGNNSIRAEVVDGSGTVLASATFQPIVLANVDVVTAVLTTSRAPVMQGGLAWRGGDVTVSMVPTIFTGAANMPTNLTVRLQASGAGVIENGTCNTLVAGACPALAETATDATPADGFSVTFSSALSASTIFGSSTSTPGVANIEDPFIGVTIGGQVASGNPYIGNFIVLMDGVPVSQTSLPAVGANVLRLDNLAPRVTLLDLTPATLACVGATTPVACYVNDDFPFAATNQGAATPSSFARTVDFGVDAQTTTFAAGASGAAMTTFTSGGDLPETEVAQTYLLSATTTDALGNSRTVFATDVNTCVSASSTSVTTAGVLGPVGAGCFAGVGGVTRLQRFGVDVTPPTVEAIDPSPSDGGANEGATYSFSYIDVGSSATAGPSGFTTEPLSVKVERILVSGTTCFNSEGTATVTPCNFDSDEGTVSLPASEAYFRVTAFVTDQAGNSSDEVVLWTLIDATSPNVGGIVASSITTGGGREVLRASATDNVELGDVKAAIGFGGLVTLGFHTQALATYGPTPDFLNSTTIEYAIEQWIWSIETTDGAGRPTGMITEASMAEFDVRDMAGVTNDVACVLAPSANCDVTQQDITANVPNQPNSWTALNTTFASANAAHGNFRLSAPSPTSVCNGGSNACIPSNQATSTTLRATATGPNATFANPFQRVVFYYIDADGRAQVIGTGSAVPSDDTITSTRTWTYSTSWSVVGLAPAGYQVFALGIDSSGRALMTGEATVTVEDQ